MMRPFSWKYLTSGAAFCLKFISLLWVAFRLSSGRPCCSARFSNLSLSLWLAQARNTTKSGVQICGGHQTSRQAFNTPNNESVRSDIHLFWFCGGCCIFCPLCFCQHISRATTLKVAKRSSYYRPCKWHTPTWTAICSGPPYFRKTLFVYTHMLLGWIKNSMHQTLPKYKWLHFRGHGCLVTDILYGKLILSLLLLFAALLKVSTACQAQW